MVDSDLDWMTSKMSAPVSWQKTKYEFVKGTLSLTAEGAHWAPLKANHADELIMRLEDISDVKRTKPESPAALLRVLQEGVRAPLVFDCVSKDDRDALFDRLQDLLAAKVPEDSSGAAKSEVQDFIPLVNDGVSWGGESIPEDLLGTLFRCPALMWTPAMHRTIRLVCKRWQRAHGLTVMRLKPCRWSEVGLRGEKGEEGLARDTPGCPEGPDADVVEELDKEEAELEAELAPQGLLGNMNDDLFSFPTPTPTTLLVQFEFLAGLDFSATDCRPWVSDATMGVVGVVCVALSSLTLRNCTRVTHQGVKELIPLSPHLRTLDLTACFRIGDAGVKHICKLTGLVCLRLGETSRVTDEGLTQLAAAAASPSASASAFVGQSPDGDDANDDGQDEQQVNIGFKSLEELDLHLCREITALGVQALAESGIPLRRLDLSDCRKLCQAGVKSLVSLSSSLEGLKLIGYGAAIPDEGGLSETLEGMSAVNELTLEWSPCVDIRVLSSLGLASSCSHCLRVLQLKGCGALHCSDLQSLPALPALTALDLTWCTQVLDAGLEAVVGCAENLSWLVLKGCERVTDQGVTYLARLPHLSTLDLSGCAGVKGTGLKYLACGVLRSLNVGMCRFLSSEGIASIAFLSTLTSLSINSSTAVSVASLNMLAPSLPQLMELSLQDCPLMQDDVAEEFLPVAPSLTSLDLSYSQRLTDKGVVQIAKLSNLTSLSLHACSRISNKSMAPIARLTHLTRLGIGQCRNITSEGLIYLVSQRKSLAELDLSGVCTTLDLPALKKSMPEHVHLIQMPVKKEAQGPERN